MITVLLPNGSEKEQREVSPAQLDEVLKGYAFTGAYGKESLDRFYSSSPLARLRADRGSSPLRKPA